MKNVFVPLRNIELFKNIVEGKNAPLEFTYGAYWLDNNKFSVSYAALPRVHKYKFLKLIEKIFTRITKIGFCFEIWKASGDQIKKSDIIYCVNDAIAFGVLFFKMLKFHNCKVVSVFQCLTERNIKYFNNNFLINFFIKKLLSNSEKIVVLSEEAKKSICIQYLIDESIVEILHFGADLNFWKPIEQLQKKNDYILTIGNDFNRDFKIIENHVASNYQVIAVTNQKISNSKIKKVTNISNEEVRSLYQNAKLTLTCSGPVQTESSGLSTCVQSLACGTPVLMSYVKGVNEIFNNNEVIFFEPENPSSVLKSIELIWSDEDKLKNLRDIGLKKSKEFNMKNTSTKLNQILSDL